MGWITDCINRFRATLGAPARTRLRYDWFLCRWMPTDHVMAVMIGGPLHGRALRIPRHGLSPLYARHTRHDYEWRIPYPQRYTAVLFPGEVLPPDWEVRALAQKARVIRWPSSREMTRISCIASGVPYAE